MGAVATRREALETAFAWMRSALELLDAVDAPPHIGAHLDLAICELQKALDRPDAQSAGDGQATSQSGPQA